MKWLRRLGWLGIGLAVTVMLAWAVAPRVIQSQGERLLTERLGRQVRIGQVHLRPWSLELTLRDVSVAGSTPQVPLLRVGRLYANAEISSLWQRAPVLSALEIDAPVLQVSRLADGRYDIDDLIARLTPDQAAPSGEPPRFALNNVQLREGSLRFDDRPVGRVHELRHLVLTLPFLSNLPADIEVTVEPRLAFALDDAVFDSGAQSTPFARDRSTSMKLRIGSGGRPGAGDAGEVDLASYAGYLPQQVPLRLTRGFLAAELDLAFSLKPDGTPTIALTGHTRARDVELTDTTGVPLLSWRRLGLDWREVRPLSRRLQLGEVRLEGARLRIERDRDGVLNLNRLVRRPSVAPDGATAEAATAPARQTAPSWQVGAEKLVIDDSRVAWRDGTTRPAVSIAAEDLSIGARDLQWPSSAPVPVTLNAMLRSSGPPSPPSRGVAASAAAAQAPVPTLVARVEVDGEVSPSSAALQLRLGEGQLAALQPYLTPLLSASLQPRLEGRVQFAGRLDWADGKTPRLAMTLDEAQFDALRLVSAGARRGPAEMASLRQLRLGRVEIDLQRHRLELGRVQLQAPSISVVRSAAGRLNVQDWAATTPATGRAAGSSRAAAAPAVAPADGADWRVRVGLLSVEAGRVVLTDLQPGADRAPGAADGPARPPSFTLSPLSVELRDFAHGVPGAGASRLSLRTRLAAGAAPGRAADAPAPLEWRGRLALAPLMLDGTARIERLPLHAFQAYVSHPLRLELLRALGSYRGEVALREQPAGYGVTARGDLNIGELAIVTRPTGPVQSPEDLLNWQDLALTGLQVTVEPDRRPRVQIVQADLRDFFTRLAVTEQGRFNLLDVVGSNAGPATSPPSGPGADAAPAAPPAEGGEAPAVAQTYPVATSAGGSIVAARTPVAGAATSAGAGAPAAVPGTGLPFDLSVQATRLRNGRIAFSDRFVKPNFSADLSELEGSIGAFRSGSSEQATLELAGRIAGTGRLEVQGRLNPTADPLALDLQAKASDIELPPLSPYAGKYAGYAIERGKLSLDVRYDIQPDGRLDAKHQLVLNQLRFGERIDSPQATSLPVRLAVALLQDRDGVIDLNLPVSGSLEDPQFSLWGVAMKVLGNLLAKAATAPFALLSGSQSQDLSVVEFVPGTAQMTADGKAALERIGTALAERPRLRVSIAGAAAQALEEDALRHVMFEQRLRAERRRDAARGGAAPLSVAEALDDAERQRVLKRLYRNTELPDRPRNFLGRLKDVPGEQMEAMLLADTRVPRDALRELALQRSMAVREALVAQGLPADRLFLSAPRLHDAVGPVDDDGHPWTPRAQLTLAPD